MSKPTPAKPINAADILCGLYLLREEELLRHGLTKRELVVAQHILNGESTQSIAKRLRLSVPGVKYHVSNILTKTKRRSREELCTLVRQGVATSCRTWRDVGDIQRQAEGRIVAPQRRGGDAGGSRKKG